MKKDFTIFDMICFGATSALVCVLLFQNENTLNKDANKPRTPEPHQTQVGEHWQDIIIALSKRAADLLARVETLEQRVATLTEERDQPRFSPSQLENMLPYMGWPETNTLEFPPPRRFTNSDIDWRNLEGTIILAP